MIEEFSERHFKSKTPPTDRTTLMKTEAFEIVSIDWTSERKTSLHDHGWSQSIVLIEDGVFLNRLDLGAKIESQILEKGQVSVTPVGAKHEMRCQTPKGKTLHIYTPMITEFETGGVFRARSNDSLLKDISLIEPTQLDTLTKIVARLHQQSISTHSPYFMNQLFAGILPQMLIAEDFIAKTRTTLATFEASPVLSNIEVEVVRALGQMIGWHSSQSSGISVPGGSAANFMALHCARHRALPETKQKGSVGHVLQIFVSEEAHYSFKKACAVLGLGTENLVAVPVDQRGRMQPRALDDLVSRSRAAGSLPLLVAATAGTTVLGAFDDISALSLICKKHAVWLHVDGAWGGPALFSKKLRHLVQGIELADSMTFDAHKLFGANLTSSFFLTQHRQILLEANDVSGGDYLFHSDDTELDRGKLSWQCGRKADAMSFWTIWKSLGTVGLGEFVDRLMWIQREALVWIKDQKRLELVANPEYLNICVRVVAPDGTENPDWSRKVRERLKDQHQAMVNYSTDQRGSFLRLILAHPFLELAHVKQILSWALACK